MVEKVKAVSKHPNSKNLMKSARYLIEVLKQMFEYGEKTDLAIEFKMRTVKK